MMKLLYRWEEKSARECEAKPVAIRASWCFRCGKPLQEAGQEYCRDCQRGQHLFDRGRAVFTYDSVAASLYRFKYRGRQEYAEYYGEAAARLLSDEKELREAQMLVPVPLHPARMRQRGYNQALLFAKELGKAWKIPVCEDLVVRCRNTQPLKQLNPSERQNNLKKAFKIKRNVVKLNTIIVVDDIYTTGSTIDAVSGVLSEAGAKRLYFVTIAGEEDFKTIYDRTGADYGRKKL